MLTKIFRAGLNLQSLHCMTPPSEFEPYLNLNYINLSVEKLFLKQRTYILKG